MSQSPDSKTQGIAKKLYKRGFALAYVLIILTVLLSTTAAMFSLIIKQVRLAAFASDGMKAYYMGESGMECAIYQNSRGVNFASESPFECGGDPNLSGLSFSVPDHLGTDSCAQVLLTLEYDYLVRAESRGLSDCVGVTRRVERGVKALYPAYNPLFYEGDGSVPSLGLVGHWTFDTAQYVAGDTNSEVKDSSGYNNYGNAFNINTLPQTGAVNQGLTFDGVDDKVEILSDSAFDISATNGFSVSLWFKKTTDCNSPEGNEVMISRYGTTNIENTWWMGCEGSSDKLTARLYDNSGSAVLSSNGIVDNGLWHHGVWTYSGATNQFRLYLDNSLQNSTILTLDGNLTSSQPICIGRYKTGSTCDGYEFGGMLDDVRVYDYQLTGAEIATLYGLGSGSGDTTAPVISNGAPTGILAYGTTQTTMSVTTNEAATCRWSSSDQAYASMPITFSTTGGTSHSTTLTGLTNGTSYTRYVRCIDGTGNANTSSTVIAFSVSATQGSSDITTGLHIYYQYENNLDDSAGTAQNATFQGTPSYVTAGKIGKGLEFNTNGEYTSTANPALPTGDFTYAAWIYPTNTSGEAIFGIGGGGEVGIYIAGDAFGVDIDGTAIIDGVGSPSVNTWQHVVVTRSGSTITMYKNGVVIGTGTSGLTLAFGSCDLYVGARITNSGCTGFNTGYLNGNIDEVRIYNRALTSTDVSALYAYTGGSGATTPPVISNGAPSGTLSTGTTQTTMSVTTDENAICKWSTTDQAYSSMPNTFSTTGATSHSTTLTGLTNGTSYTRYVRCIDGSNNANTTSTVISFSVASTGGDITSSLTGYWAFNNNANDSSGNGYNGTAAGSPVYTTGKIAQGIVIDGVNDSVTIASNSAFNITQSESFSGALWFKKSTDCTSSQGNEVAFSRFGTDHVTKTWWFGCNASTDEMTFVLYNSSSNFLDLRSTGTIIDDNVWHHAAFTYDGAIDQAKIYIDGVLKNTATFALNATYNIANPVCIGMYNATCSSFSFDATIDDVRFYKRALTAADVSSLFAYTGGSGDTTAPSVSNGAPSGTLAAGTTQTTMSVTTNENATCKWSTSNQAYSSMPNTFSSTGGTSHSTTLTGLTGGTSYTRYVRCQDTAGNPNTSSTVISFSVTAGIGLVGHYAFDNAGSPGSDTSGQGNNGTASGGPSSVAGTLNLGLLFDGVNDMIVVPPRPTLDMNDRMSIAFWMKMPNGQLSFAEIIDKLSGTGKGWKIQALGTGPNIEFRFDTTGGTNQKPAAIANVMDDSWHHVAWTINSGVVNAYKDGVQVVTNAAYTHGTGFGNTDNFEIGESGSPVLFAGVLDDVRVYDTVLTSSEVNALYALAGDITSPSVSNGSPSGALAAGTTQTTMSVTTNEAATCKWSTSNQAYSSMPNTFTTTGGTSHSTMLTGLTNNTSYTRYVRCIDGSSNVNTSSTVINFSVGAGDTTPPVISNGAPSGTLAAGTTQTTMSVTTNENATCRWATTNVTYPSMPNNFTSTGGTSHSTTLTSLTNGNSYTRYVRCQDTAGNPTTSSTVISFSVANPADTTPPVISNGAPSGTLSAGTTQTTMSVTTNEAATCKWSTSNQAYSSMPNTFSTTGATSHSTTLTGLTNGTSYTRYVRCQDTAGNPTTSSTIISFSVANAGNITSNLSAHWPFDSNANDISGNSNNGTLNGNAAIQTATKKIGAGALALDGWQDYMSRHSSASLLYGTGDFSYSLWIKTDDTCGSVNVFLGQSAVPLTSSLNIWLGCNTSGQAHVSLSDSNGVTRTVSSTQTINNNAWHHLVIVKQGQSGTLKLYVDNGTPFSTNTSFTGNFDISGNPQTWVGSFGPNQYYADGFIDDVRIYKRALNATDINALFQL